MLETVLAFDSGDGAVLPNINRAPPVRLVQRGAPVCQRENLATPSGARRQSEILRCAQNDSSDTRRRPPTVILSEAKNLALPALKPDP